jgi:hypothetical protein
VTMAFNWLLISSKGRFDGWWRGTIICVHTKMGERVSCYYDQRTSVRSALAKQAIIASNLDYLQVL